MWQFAKSWVNISILTLGIIKPLAQVVIIGEFAGLDPTKLLLVLKEKISMCICQFNFSHIDCVIYLKALL